MRLTVIPADKTIILDGDAVQLEEIQTHTENIHAIQWNGGTGTIEYTLGPGEAIKDAKVLDTYIEQYNAAKTKPQPDPIDPGPEPEAPLPLTACTPAQGLVALYVLKGIKEEDILTAIDSIPDAQQRYLTSIAFRKATLWEQGSANFQSLATLLSLDEEAQGELLGVANTIMV